MTKALEISESLHPLERKVLPLLLECSDLESLEKKSGLKEVEVMRALQWLENKKVLVIKATPHATISLDVNGKRYIKEGLPEKRFLKVLSEKSLSLKDIQEKAALDSDETTISIGLLKQKALIELGKEVSITDEGKRYLGKKSLEEGFLDALPLDLEKLSDEQKYAYDQLSKRKLIIKIDYKTKRTFTLTELGKELVKVKISGDSIEALTPAMLKTGEWKKKKFRHYDISSVVPKIQFGKKHPVNQAIDYVRRIWLDMGFKEMHGKLLETSFWNFDALFVPQDHPSRELQDTFFIKNPKRVVSPNKELVKRIKEVHENGGDTGSKGWGGEWDEEDAGRNILITHDTYLSAQVLANVKKEDLPVKTFQLMKVFRNEVLDWKHLFEFYQVGGIVVDKDVHFRHLLGYLKEFFKKMGFERVRFRPAYFPYTEPSVEIDVFHPTRKEWIELGGSGVFRPEVVKPLLGADVPVLAWGLGLERIMTDYYKINDLRDVYKNDIKKLREFGVFLE